MSELKRCPFCGGEADYTQILGNYGRVYCFTCDGGIREGRSKDGVIHNWNSRPIEDALNARIAKLEAENAELKERIAMLDTMAVFKSLGEMGYIEQVTTLNAHIAELEAERRWRVVADGELPELGKEVIFYDSKMERRLKGCLRKNGGVEWLSDEGYTFSSRDGRYSWITHWMPLPKLPEVQE